MLIINHPLIKLRHTYYTANNNMNKEVYELDTFTYNILPKYFFIKEDKEISFHWKTEDYLFAGSYYWWEKGFIDTNKNIIIKNNLSKDNLFKKSDIRINKINDKEFELCLKGKYKINKSDLKKIGLEELIKFKNKKFELFLFKPGKEINFFEKQLTFLFNRKKYIYETHYVITFDKLKTFSLKDDLSDLKEFLYNFIGEKFEDLQQEYINLGMIKQEDKKENLSNFIDYVLENDKLYLDTKIFVNKTGKQFFEVYSKTFDLLVYISKFIDYVNKNKAEDKSIEEKLSKLKIELDKGEKLNLDKLLNGELYKGDNYHALNLLQNKYYEEIKTIYIDPPYNTGNDGFLYKDNMKHATWLTMMESRLKLARELMKEEAGFFSFIDEYEKYNLKPLLDKFFYIQQDFIWNYKTIKNMPGEVVKRQYDDIFLYSKNKKFKTNYLHKPYGLKYFESFFKEYIDDDNLELNIIENYTTLYTIEWLKKYENKIKKTSDFIKECQEEFFKNKKNKIGFKLIEELENFIWNKIFKKRNFFRRREGYIQPLFKDGKILGNKINAVIDEQTIVEKRDEDVLLTNGQKPERLIKKLLEIIIAENEDLLLDYFAGSGTTCAVAHKMGRKYIGCEINDYFDKIITPRLKKVLNGEQGGISKQENWQGGGFFKYSYLESYEDTLENFVLKLEDTLHNKEFQEKDLENNLYNLALAVGMAFNENKIKTSFKNFQLKENKTYPSYKLETKRNDIHSFVEEKFEKKALKTFVDLVHYYPLTKEGKWSLKSVKKENGEFVFEYENKNGETEFKKFTN